MSGAVNAGDLSAVDFVTFTIGNQLFGIPVCDVQDVFSPQSITRVPLAPPEVGGVLNLRGRIVTAIDVRERLGLLGSRDTAPSMAIGIEKGGESYGLIIDRIGEVLRLEPERFERSPENLDRRWRGVSKGVYRLEDTLLVVLDVDMLTDFDNAVCAA